MIISHGMSLLKEHNLKPFFMARVVELMLDGISSEVEINRILKKEKFHEPDESIAPWSSWKLVIDGQEYHSNFKSHKEWKEHYSGE